MLLTVLTVSIELGLFWSQLFFAVRVTMHLAALTEKNVESASSVLTVVGTSRKFHQMFRYECFKVSSIDRRGILGWVAVEPITK